MPVIVVTWLIALRVIPRALGGECGDDGLRFTLYDWIEAGVFRVDVGLPVEELTAVLLFVVTMVGMLAGNFVLHDRLLYVPAHRPHVLGASRVDPMIEEHVHE